MSQDFTIQNEKIQQIPELLKRHNIDVWLIFVRETTLTPDPALDLILGMDVTWVSAFLITRTDDRIAIVGRYDTENVERMGGFKEIIGYDEDIYPELIKTLTHLNPERIAVNFSDHDPAADGLTHGLWRQLNNALVQTSFKHRLVTAERLIASLRGQKTVSEIKRVQTAIKTTEGIIHSLTDKLTSGLGEQQIYDLVQGEMRKHDVIPAWDHCPIVTAGPDSPVGHSLPDNRYQTTAGQLLHIDLGVEQNGYVSDMQRVWYLKKSDEDGVPEPVQKAFNAVRGSILVAAKVLKPGVMGYEVDAVARKYIVELGYPEYKHALGHHIGRTVHDGSTVLGPRWARYGKTIEGVVEEGNIFTLELGVHVPDYGLVSLEEDVLVKPDGIEWLSTPQEEIIVVDVE